ncbi:MAG: Bor family protein [Rubricoccaceae bacterium]|nr:Bor family protein [Rubricoccaceae bacterium]
MRLLSCGLLLFAFATTGCYHSTVVTGATPGDTVIEEDFASSWINGLVPPKDVRTAALCPNGVAIVETKLSFLNQLVGALTMGIYTPMHITVTCAAEQAASAGSTGAEVIVPSDANADDIVQAFEQAANEAVTTGEPAFVRFANR